MALNLTKTYTVKSNAQADIRKAIAHGEAVAGEFTVASLSGGFRIVPHNTAAEAARWPAGTTPGLARLRANGHAEKIRQEVLADQEAASANASAAIAAASAAAMTETLAAARDTFEVVAEMAMLNAVIPDEPIVTTAKAAIQRVVQNAIAKGSPVIVEQRADAAPDAAQKPAAAKPAGLSDGAAQVLRALVQVAGDGAWIDQKAIPHGLVGRAAPGYLAGLQKRGLVELRADKGGKFFARMTAAALTLRAEAGR